VTYRERQRLVAVENEFAFVIVVIFAEKISNNEHINASQMTRKCNNILTAHKN